MKKYWTTQVGDEIEYKKLKDSHLLNILKWIERHANEIEGDEVLEIYDYKGLLEEAKKRKLKI